MKYMILVANGMSDLPIAEKDNRSPLQLAETPNLDRLAGEGKRGSVVMQSGSSPLSNESSYLSLMGYDASDKATIGAGHAVASALNVSLDKDEIPLCCDLVILQPSHNDMIMKDFTAGEIPTKVSTSIVDFFKENILEETATFHTGRGSTHLMVLKTAPYPDRLTPPYELIGEGIRKYIPQGEAYKDLVRILNHAQIALNHHPHNKQRVDAGKDRINSVWFWGNGQDSKIEAFYEKFGKTAALVSGSLLFQGMAKKAGLDIIEVPGATGFLGTDLSSKVTHALEALNSHDVVFLHIAGAEIASLLGNIEDKILALEDIDLEVVAPLMKKIEDRQDVKLLVTEIQQCSALRMRYQNDPVPFSSWTFGSKGDGKAYDEEILKEGPPLASATKLIEAFLGDSL